MCLTARRGPLVPGRTHQTRAGLRTALTAAPLPLLAAGTATLAPPRKVAHGLGRVIAFGHDMKAAELVSARASRAARANAERALGLGHTTRPLSQKGLDAASRTRSGLAQAPWHLL